MDFTDSTQVRGKKGSLFMHRSIRLSLASMLFVAPAAASAASGSFSSLTYNIAGLPQGLSSAPSDREPSTEVISCYVNPFDMVHVQEDFNYHAALYDTCDSHPYRSPTSGGAGIGSGLNTMSRFPYDDWDRVTWNDRNGVDALTPKGFTMARVRLQEGVFVDIYNLHAQAQTADADLAARRKNILQLIGYIESVSAGRAVIVMGDTNTRYTRSGDNIWEMLNRGFTDVWVQRFRGGSVPVAGASDLTCGGQPYTGYDCEIVDKVLFRGNGYVTLDSTDYVVRTDAKNSAGQDLSDHPPVQANWTYSTDPNLQLSDAWGGPHGDAFDDVSLLPDSPVVKTLSIRSGERLDHVETTLSSGYVLSHGGSGGSPASLFLSAGEYLSSATLCSGQKDGRTRVYYAQFATNTGRTLTGGTTTSSCTTYTAPADFQIVAFHGRAGDEVDRLGMVYARRQAAASGPTSYYQIINRASGRCLDIAGAAATNGTTIDQWDCNGGDWQKWSYDAKTGLIRSKQDPRYCLDNGGQFSNGANLVLWQCVGNANQRFAADASKGEIRMRSLPDQAVDGYGTSDGAVVGTWSFWGGQNQLWNFIP